MINQTTKSLQRLGLIRRAGQVVTGEGDVIKAMQQQQTRLVFLAADAGAATQKKFRDKANTYQVTLCEDFTRLELSQALGQSRSSVAITQAGFTKKLLQLLEQTN
ncbi:MAG: ribosomal L7Ae/L30e/S12e/Gadd45 family protein [Limosilactobacillus sp.]|nr:ribosomal L7Ae/L30e/S12e/Gadd45 family protein [Limosilactobacillus sp.]